MNIQIYNQVKFYNPTLEDFECQSDNKVYVFKKQAYTFVPAHIAELVYSQWCHRGIFIVNEDTFTEDRRAALLKYVENHLDNRIRNYRAFMDDERKRGVTNITETHELKETIRWKKEILAMLEKEKPVKEFLSYEVKEEPKPSKRKKTTEIEATLEA